MMIRPRWTAALIAIGALVGCGDGERAARAALADYPELGSARFEAFARACGACHRPPQPARHTAREWRLVVARMARHRAERGMAPIDRRTQAVVLDYLTTHANAEGADR